MLKLEPIWAQLQDGRGVDLEPNTVEERSRLAREVRNALEERKAALEMAENKAERKREEE